MSQSTLGLSSLSSVLIGLQKRYRIAVFGESGDKTKLYNGSLKSELIQSFASNFSVTCPSLGPTRYELIPFQVTLGNERTDIELVDTTGKFLVFRYCSDIQKLF